MFQDIFDIGATGNVGRATINQVFDSGDTNPNFHPNPTRVVGLASSYYFIYNPVGLSPAEVKSFFENPSTGQPYSHLNDLVDLASNDDYHDRMLTFIDTTADKDRLLAFHKHIIDETTYSLVTANKNPLAFCDFATFERLVGKVNRYKYSPTIMAGSGVIINILRSIRDTREKILSLEACLSGTNGFVTSEARFWKPFSNGVRKAVAEGYSEPNVAEDLRGADAAKKILIAARTLGFPVNYEDINLEPLVPMPYLLGDSSEEVIESIRRGYDSKARKDFFRAFLRGEVLRNVSYIRITQDGEVLGSGPKYVSKKSELGLLNGTTNAAIITTNRYTEDNPLVIKGPGAGLSVTAASIRKDVADLLLADRKLISAEHVLR